MPKPLWDEPQVSVELMTPIDVNEFLNFRDQRAEGTKPSKALECAVDAKELATQVYWKERGYKERGAPTVAGLAEDWKLEYDPQTDQLEPYVQVGDQRVPAWLANLLETDLFSTLYFKRSLNEGKYDVISKGTLYLNATESCQVPVVAVPRGLREGKRACPPIVGEATGEVVGMWGPEGPQPPRGKTKTITLYDLRSKRYMERSARLWLAIWPAAEKPFIEVPTESGTKKIYVLGPFENFFLQAISEARSERSQILLNTAEFPLIAYFFGRNPPVVNMVWIVKNDQYHNWKEQFIQLYETTFRAYELVRNQWIIYIDYEDVLLGGYLLNMSLSERVGSEDAVGVSMSLLMTRRATLEMEGFKDLELEYVGDAWQTVHVSQKSNAAAYQEQLEGGE